MEVPYSYSKLALSKTTVHEETESRSQTNIMGKMLLHVITRTSLILIAVNSRCSTQGIKS
jgi:hypothetical protein